MYVTSLSVRKEWKFDQPFVRNVAKLIETLSCDHSLITHHDVWSVCVTKKFNDLPAIFEKYPKMVLFHTFATLHI